MNHDILIIPDIHTQFEWVEEAISALSPSKVVFLGDYFDAAGATPEVQEATAEWLRHSLEQPSRVHLLGNHDVQYAFSGNRWSGYDERAHPRISAVLGKDWGERLHLHHWDQGHLLTHAGVHPDFWPGTSAEFDKRCAEAMDALRNNRRHPLLNCGNDRGGTGRSGLLWLDFHWSFEPIPGIAQIVGHTKCLGNARHVGGKYILEPECIRDSCGTENWNLDTKCAWLGLLSDGGLKMAENVWKRDVSSKLKSLDSSFGP